MKRKKGFSLVELLIVIGIIAVLGGVMLTQFSGSTESALAASCLNNMRTLCNAVLAEASKDDFYPAAGPYEYLDIDASSENYNRKCRHQGWIGNTPTDESVSCYYEASGAGDGQYGAITNGAIWRSMGGARGAYVCPAHTKHCKRGNLPVPAWSYAMNSYFGWNTQKAFAGETGGRRSYGHGMFTFKFTSSPTSRLRPADRVLLFAEIPFVNNGLQNPDYSTSPDFPNDMTLQFANEDGGVEKSNRSAGAGSAPAEAIGFNHKSGNDYLAHVAFADGHCAKLVMPRDANAANLVSLTSWLCTGQDYTFNGAIYEKATE